MQQDHEAAARDRQAAPAGVGIHHGVSGADVDADFHAFFKAYVPTWPFHAWPGKAEGRSYRAALAFEAVLLFASLRALADGNCCTMQVVL